MWKYAIEEHCSEDVSLLLSNILNYAPTNQITVQFENSLYQIQREEYFPNKENNITFNLTDNWSNNAYSVAEMSELLDKYHETIDKVRFKVPDGSLQKAINITESSDYSNVVFYTKIIIGNGSDPINFKFRESLVI